MSQIKKNKVLFQLPKKEKVDMKQNVTKLQMETIFKVSAA